MTFANDLTITFLKGEDWDELEKKAAKCKANLFPKVQVATNCSNFTADKKRVEGGRTKDDESDDEDRPKKKAPAKSKKSAANGKGKR